jgi:hypothetical protein
MFFQSVRLVGAVGIEEKPQFLSLIVRWRCSRSFQQLLILLIRFPMTGIRT